MSDSIRREPVLSGGSKLAVAIQDVAFGGEGVARVDDFVLFVPFVLIGEEVEVEVTVTVARSQDEAERINRGEDISTRNEDRDAAAEAIAAAGEFFDPEAQQDESAPAAEETEK